MPEEIKNLGEKFRRKPVNFLLVLCLCAAISAGFMNFVGADFDAQMKNNGEIGTGEQIQIDFSEPVLIMNSDNIAVSPAINFSYSLSDDRKSLIIIPDSDLKPEEKYTITLNGLRGMNGMVMDDKKIVFYTQASGGKNGSPIKLTSNSDSQFGEMTLSPDKYVIPANSVVKEDYHPEPHIMQGKYIDVSVSHQIMTIFEDGQEVNQFLVSTGKLGMETPRGEFKIKTKEKNHWSTQYKLWMPYSMNFNGPDFIHELPYWPNGYREGENHLGKKVSHGCIRLGIGPAKYVFDWAEIGTPVYIHE